MCGQKKRTNNALTYSSLRGAAGLAFHAPEMVRSLRAFAEHSFFFGNIVFANRAKIGFTVGAAPLAYGTGSRAGICLLAQPHTSCEFSILWLLMSERRGLHWLVVGYL